MICELYEVKVHPAGSHLSVSTTTHSTNTCDVSVP